MTDSVENAVVAALAEMGYSPGTLPCTIALSEGRQVAQKFFEGGYAVWTVGSGMFEVLRRRGKTAEIGRRPWNCGLTSAVLFSDNEQHDG